MEVLATPLQALSAGQAGTQGTEPAFASHDDLRVQTRCCLTVRIAWDVSSGHHHPPFTFTCAENTEMAATAALRAAEVAHQGIRFAGVAVSATGRKYGLWVPLDLGGRL